jgi:hypothetical protein
MRFVVTMLSIGCSLALVSGASLAGESCGGFDVVEHIFEMSDADASGALSPEEFAEAGLERYGVPFEDYDADADGQASRDEYHAVYDRHHPGHGGHEI